MRRLLVTFLHCFFSTADYRTAMPRECAGSGLVAIRNDSRKQLVGIVPNRVEASLGAETESQKLNQTGVFWMVRLPGSDLGLDT